MVIQFKDVTFRYPDSPDPVLKNLDLEVEAGEFIAILGHNGSGKSTIAKLCNAILTPTEGTVLVKGLDTRVDANLIPVRQPDRSQRGGGRRGLCPGESGGGAQGDSPPGG